MDFEGDSHGILFSAEKAHESESVGLFTNADK